MNNKEAITKLKNTLKSLFKFATANTEYTTKDGIKISSSADELAIGSEVFLIDADGNQQPLEDGIYTIYNFNNDIYKQFNLYEIKDQFSGKPLFEVREERTSIDFDKTFNKVTTI